eukprot:Opistho-1_new@52457
MVFLSMPALETLKPLQCQHHPARKEPRMQIKDLARATGVDVETIRFYEKEGLLPEPARLDNGYRNYAQPHLERLSFIRHCRALDMPLPDVKRLLGFVDDPHVLCVD